MSYYRLYFMDTFSGHIERFEEFEADDESKAVALAETKRGPLALELWCAHRKLVRIEPVDLASQLLARRREVKAVKAHLEQTDTDNTQSESRTG